MTDHANRADGHADGHVREPAVPGMPARRPWVHPTLVQLPHLSSLTLASGDPISGGGGTGGGGSTVF